MSGLASLLDNVNFARWFGGSKVRTPWGGDPVPVYHGTPRAGFDAFDEFGGNFGLFGDGLYFTENPAIASQYAMRGKGDAPGVIKGYLSIKNPMVMESDGHSGVWAKAFPDAAEHFTPGDTNAGQFEALKRFFAQENIPSYEAADIVRAGLENMGHDGLTHFGGGIHKNSDGTSHRVWIAMQPEQFKSAFNSGSYSPVDNSFLRSIAPAAATTGLMGGYAALSPGSAEAATYAKNAQEQALDSNPWIDPVGMLVAALTGGGSLSGRAVQAGIDPAANAAADAFVGLMSGLWPPFGGKK